MMMVVMMVPKTRVGISLISVNDDNFDNDDDNSSSWFFR